MYPVSSLCRTSQPTLMVHSSIDPSVLTVVQKTGRRLLSVKILQVIPLSCHILILPHPSPTPNQPADLRRARKRDSPRPPARPARQIPGVRWNDPLVESPSKPTPRRTFGELYTRTETRCPLTSASPSRPTRSYCLLVFAGSLARSSESHGGLVQSDHAAGCCTCAEQWWWDVWECCSCGTGDDATDGCESVLHGANEYHWGRWRVVWCYSEYRRWVVWRYSCDRYITAGEHGHV